MLGVTVRLTSPSRSSPRKLSVSIRCEIGDDQHRPLIADPRQHLVDALAGGAFGIVDHRRFPGRDRVTKLCLGIEKVPSCDSLGTGYLECLSNKSIPRIQR